MNNELFDKIEGENAEQSPMHEAEEHVPVIELFDENGERLLFVLLDTIEYENDKYCFLTPYNEDEFNLQSAADVFIMKEVTDGCDIGSDGGNNGDPGGEPLLETVEDMGLLYVLYDIFKSKQTGKFEFRE